MRGCSYQGGFYHEFGLCAYVCHNPLGSNLECFLVTFKLFFADDLVDLQLLEHSQFLLICHSDKFGIKALLSHFVVYPLFFTDDELWINKRVTMCRIPLLLL